MRQKLSEFFVPTQKRYQLIDITGRVEEIVKENGVKNGLVLVFVAHSTAAVLLTENEEGLKKDWLDVLKKLVADFDFQHNRIAETSSHLPKRSEGREMNEVQRTPPHPASRGSAIDDNADSHILSGLVGQAIILPVKEGRLIRGTWQQIFLAEFDGPKTRKVIIEVIGD